MLNLINEPDDVDKIYLYAVDLNKPKYEFLIKKRKNTGIKHLIDPKVFVECSNTMDGIYENIDDYNPHKKRKALTVSDGIIADLMKNKKFKP